MLITSCSSHTDKIKQQLGDKFDEQVYVDLGGEKDSINRYQKYCQLFKTKKENPVQVKMAMLSHKPSFTDDELNLGNAEINLAAKDCN